jgi:hypothetical protein
MRKLIGFDEDTADKLTQLGRDRMATLQELADEAFADLLKKHGVPIDLKDALRKSAKASDSRAAAKKPHTAPARPARKTAHARR